ncbi:transcription antitermination factor NusB [Clostridium sp.]|uniref:transcription antitermination factor NusB n=1 Tax=Clostridium sp. TaxID=1506 RepID=UPI00399054A2
MKRKRSREIAMELLFSMEISKNSYEETIECFVEDYEMDLKTIDLEYIKEVMKSVVDHKEEIDEIIKNSLINWTIDRVSKVNLTIVRLAIAEMLYINDVPEVVAINEAIELTKKYSDYKSVSFVNGALDKAFKNIK